MTKEHAEARTRTSRLIRARAEELYSAFLDPTALIDWLPPGRCVTFRRAPPCAEGSAWAGLQAPVQMTVFAPVQETVRWRE